MLARLQPGDRSFVAWTFQKRAFLDDVKRVIRADFAAKEEAAEGGDVHQFLMDVCPDIFMVKTSIF